MGPRVHRHSFPDGSASLLAVAADPEEPAIRKLPPLASLGFVLVTCGGFWLLVGALAQRSL